MKFSFQAKLILAFVVLICFIVPPLLYFVNTNINAASISSIDRSLQISQKVFEKQLEFRKHRAQDAAKAFLSTQASVRAILGSSSGTDLFGGDTGGESLAKTHEILFSSVESFDLYIKNPVFLFTDGAGKLLLTKVSTKEFGTDLSNLSVVQTALHGQETVGYWGSQDSSLQSLPLLPKATENTLYQVIAIPLTFGDSGVKASMIVGIPISTADIEEIKNISQSEITFISKGVIYGTSKELKTNLNDIVKSGLSNSSLIPFTEDGEEFLGSVSSLQGKEPSEATVSLIFKSKTKELIYYNGLKKAVNAIGIVAALFAVFLGVLISGRVTKAIKLLMTGALEVGGGNLDYSVQINTRDEFSDLADAFNKMTVGLKEKETIKNTFKRYVSPQVVNALISDERKIKLGGDRRNLVVFFSDVAGFTSISEALSPEGTIDFLNVYLSEMARIIETSEGVVDKFIGDAVMAYWIDPHSLKKNSILACTAALSQQSAVKKLQEKWSDRPVLSTFGARIGIHSGEVIIGNVGSEERMDYTIIGDNVNTASRLESINKYYGTSVLISESVAKEVSEEFIIREIDLIKVVGKTKPIKIYELILHKKNLTDAVLLKLEQFAQALKSYQQGDFSKAKAEFQKLNTNYPEDAPTQIYMERCSSLILNPPVQWDGVYQAKAK